MLGYNPHLHILCADGCFGNNGIFYAATVDLHKVDTPRTEVRGTLPLGGLLEP